MTVLITGGMGCIGAWALFHLMRAGERAVCFDLAEERHRLDLLMSADEQAQITFVKGDLTDLKQVRAVFDDHGVTQVIHLAALQVPACRVNPSLGAQVNVTGTVNIFEAARAAGVKHVAYASSIAVYGSRTAYPDGLLAHDAPKLPTTFYGVYKVANEMTAQIYWQDHTLSSTVLRPYTVYGLGRDIGMTSEPTKSMQAAARGENSHINFGGRMQFHYASDMAQQFIEAAKKPLEGAFGFNLGTPAIAVTDVAALIMAASPGVTVTVGETMLPFPEACDASELYRHFEHVFETPLEYGVRETIDGFRNKL